MSIHDVCSVLYRRLQALISAHVPHFLNIPAKGWQRNRLYQQSISAQPSSGLIRSMGSDPQRNAEFSILPRLAHHKGRGHPLTHVIALVAPRPKV